MRFLSFVGVTASVSDTGNPRGVAQSEFHPGTDTGRSSGLTLSFDFCVIVDWGMAIMSTEMHVGKLLWM